jgi:hypothetical protein
MQVRLNHNKIPGKTINQGSEDKKTAQQYHWATRHYLRTIQHRLFSIDIYDSALFR